MADDAQKLKISTACDAAENFVKIYFDQFDRNRHRISKLYTEDAKLIWEGNVIDGASGITTFHQNLPKSNHSVECVDAQPIQDEATGGRSMFTISITGSVSFEDDSRKGFFQTFIIMSVNSEWRVVSDCFRFSS